MAEFKLHRQPVQENQILHLFRWAGKYWFQLVVAFFLFHLYVNRNVQVFVESEQGHAVTASLKEPPPQKALASAEKAEELSFATIAAQPAAPAPKAAVVSGKWKSTDFRNLSFVLSPDLAKRKDVDKTIVDEKMNICREYVKRFAATAITEMKEYGIPASIKLAQGLLETDAGNSHLATVSNNHFGIKCRSKCRGCTCRNYSDDDVYDMFRVFDSAWESFREHSKLLQMDRYKHLQKLGRKDYKGWAAGLKKAGYATDANYDKKLIRIIEALELHQYDK